MTNLTEQWKKGELEFGKKYYVRFDDGEIDTAQWCYYTNQNKYGFDVDEIKEVLAPVPSYEEWQAKNEENKNLYKMLDVLNKHLNSLLKEDKENRQLKELLISAKDIIEWYSTESGYIDLPTKDLLIKINNIIGEKK